MNTQTAQIQGLSRDELALLISSLRDAGWLQGRERGMLLEKLKRAYRDAA